MNVFTLTTARLFFVYSLTGYEGILASLQRVTQREAYRRAMAKGDPGLVPLINAEKPGRSGCKRYVCIYSRLYGELTRCEVHAHYVIGA